MFFFQAEDGIRDIGVTGVQTCALPILGVEAAVRRVVVLPMALGAHLEVRHRGSGPVIGYREGYSEPWTAIGAVGGRVSVADRKSVVEGKSVDLGGRRIIKKKNMRY